MDEHLLVPLARPAIRALNRQLSRALVRRLEVSFAVELSGGRTRSLFLRGDWKAFHRPSFEAFAGALLRGQFPRLDPNVRIRGSLERVRQRELRVSLNLFDWIVLEKRRSRRVEHVVTLTPEGHLLLERATSRSWLRKTRRSRQMASVVLREMEGGEGATRFRWSLEEEGRFDRSRFRNWARRALHSGIVDEVRTPPPARFPLQIRCVLVAEFSRAGLTEIRNASPEKALQRLITILEIEKPERYGVPGFWRDWMDHPEVRETIERDPVQSHLVSRYPLAGRTSAQRRQVVFDYLRARSFLDLLAAWRSRETESVLQLLEEVSNLHAFLYFNRLCPPDLKRTAASVQGDLEQVWGVKSVLLK